MLKSSTKPKGGATSYKDTSFGIISRSKLVSLEIEGIKRGLEYLESILRRKRNTRISLDFMLKLHRVSFGWIFPKWAGKLRKIQVTYSNKEAPPFYQLPELVSNLCKDAEERITNLKKPDEDSFVLEVIAFLAWFQHRLVFIHPFQDYNGRTARMVTIFLLLRLGMPAIELKAESKYDRQQYLTSMQKADDGDFSLLEKLISQALNESLEKV